MIQCGCNGDIPVPRDYFGEGKLRVAVWRPSNGNWYIKSPDTSNWGKPGCHTIQCGCNQDIPIPGDYFGEGKSRVAVWRTTDGNWYINGPEMKNWGQQSYAIV